MENASKALVIAGAILISILIIAIGMYIYNSSTDSIQEGIGSMTTQQKEAFNANWTNYEGRQTGAQVKALINKLISNANTYQEEVGKVITFQCEPTGAELNPAPANAAIADGDLGPAGDLITGLGSPYYAAQYPQSGEAQLTAYINSLNDLYRAVQARHIYDVDIAISGTTSLINSIVVNYD